MKNESISTKKIVMTAFFAAIIYLGIQSFRIPLPAAVGTPFLHFGHIFVMLAVLMLGPKLSTVAGVLGLVVFDVLNGYIQAIPNVFVSTIIKCLFVGVIFQALKKKAQGDAKKEYGYAVLCAAIYGVTNIIVDFIWSTVELVVLGRDHIYPGYDHQCRIYSSRNCDSVCAGEEGLQENSWSIRNQ